MLKSASWTQLQHWWVVILSKFISLSFFYLCYGIVIVLIKKNCWDYSSFFEQTLVECLFYAKGFLGGSAVKNPPAMQETRVQFPGREAPLGEGTGTHSSILPGKSHEQRSHEGYHPWCCKESTKLKRLSTHSMPNTILGTKDIIISKVV